MVVRSSYPRLGFLQSGWRSNVRPGSGSVAQAGSDSARCGRSSTATFAVSVSGAVTRAGAIYATAIYTTAIYTAADCARSCLGQANSIDSLGFAVRDHSSDRYSDRYSSVGRARRPRAPVFRPGAPLSRQAFSSPAGIMSGLVESAPQSLYTPCSTAFAAGRPGALSVPSACAEPLLTFAEVRPEVAQRWALVEMHGD